MIVHFLPRSRPTTFQAVVAHDLAAGKAVVVVAACSKSVAQPIPAHRFSVRAWQGPEGPVDHTP